MLSAKAGLLECTKRVSREAGEGMIILRVMPREYQEMVRLFLLVSTLRKAVSIVTVGKI